MREVDFPVALVEAVAAAVERLARPGIEGWGLRVFGGMEDAGDLMDITEHMGCTSETCGHRSHDPAAPERRWVPRNGRLVELGFDVEPGETRVLYYAHIIGNDDVRYIRLERPRFYWSEATYIESAPDWALARLASGAAV